MKDFDKWNEIKKKVDFNKGPSVKIGGVYWCTLGINIGVEQNGRSDNFQRPIVIINKFSDQFVLIAPFTTKNHRGDWYLDMEIFKIKQQIVLNQIRPIDTKRLNKRMGQISKHQINNILSHFFKLINN